MDAAGVIQPARRACPLAPLSAAGWRRRPVGGPQRLCREQRQDVREDQLLVLLLVVDAELDQLGHGRLPLRYPALEQRLERRIDMPAIAQHFFQRGAREQPALGARLPRSRGLVVGIEAVGETLIEGAKARQMRLAARTSRRTRWCAPGATWWGWRRPSAGRPGPPRSGAVPAAGRGAASHSDAAPAVRHSAYRFELRWLLSRCTRPALLSSPIALARTRRNARGSRPARATPE